MSAGPEVTSDNLTVVPSVMTRSTQAYTVAVPLFSSDVPEFEIILPCIFGLLAVVALSLVVFYTKPDDKIGCQDDQPSSPKMKGRELDEGFVR